MQQPDNQKPSISPLGDRAVLLQWPNVISEEVLHQVIQMDHKLDRNRIPGLLEIVPAYQSLAIHYNPMKITYEDLTDHIVSLFLLENSLERVKGSRFEIPVCYSSEFGIDQHDVASKLGMPIDQLIDLHSDAEYLVYMKGFLPGFIYLGGLNPELACSRRKDPRTKIPAGSVAIGGDQTGIYGIESPGGWNIIGRTPVNLFNVDSDPLSPISQGDKIKFKPIDISEYHDIQDRINQGIFELSQTTVKDQ